jgi:hypothetical protein
MCDFLWPDVRKVRGQCGHFNGREPVNDLQLVSKETQNLYFCITCVDSHVYPQRSLSRKLGIANVAWKASSSSFFMDEPMCNKGGFNGKSFSTVGAHERFLTSVCPHVPDEVGRLSEGLSADVAVVDMQHLSIFRGEHFLKRQNL